MFEFEFMRIAFAVGVLLAVIIPLLGVTTVLKRLSMSGDALSHTSLAGVAIGLVTGLNPLIMAIICAVIASLVVELIRRKFKKYSELSIAIVLSTAIGVAGLMSSFTSATNFNAYLFGSIVLVNDVELTTVIVAFILVVIFSLVYYKQIFFISYNEEEAKITGLHINAINIAHTVLTAIVVAVASKTIGALIVTALMVIPVASALQVSKSYLKTIITSIAFSLVSVVSGLVTSYYLSTKPGATIVLISVFILAICMLANKVFKLNRN